MAFVSAVTHQHTPLLFSVFLFPRDRPFVFWVKDDILGHDGVESPYSRAQKPPSLLIFSPFQTSVSPRVPSPSSLWAADTTQV